MSAETKTWTKKHLLGIEDLSAAEILHVLETADSFKEVSKREIKKVPALRGKTVVNLFYEASTRTRTSFEVAAKRLSADLLNISISTSSVVKGETLVDTVQNLEAYNIELQYGRGIDTYRGTIDLGGSPRDVDFLRVGRIALMYQTTDGAVSGAWDNSARAWVELPSGEYDSAIRKGIRIAKKQATIELLNVPVSAPEAN